MKALKQYKLRLNSVDKIEELLQELYHESCQNIERIEKEMTRLSSSVTLNEEAIEAKAKYAKAMNDFIANKDKAIGRKLEIAKLMTEVVKFNGNVKKAFTESDAVGDWDEFVQKMDNIKVEETEERQEYSIG